MTRKLGATRRRDRRIAVGLAACGLAAGLLMAPPVGAGKDKRKIQVHPGPSAIAKGLERADDGDVLRIHTGRYREAVTIEKQVRLVGVGKRRPVIDGGCTTNITVGVRHAGVRLAHLKVVGAEEGFAVDYRGVPTGRANDLVVRNTCGPAEYGINVVHSGQILIRNSRGVGFTDSAYYIGEIVDTGAGALVVRRNEAYGNKHGVIVENSRGGDIRVRKNDVHDNRLTAPGHGGEPGRPSGIFLFNSDGVLIERNRANENGLYGIRLDSRSDGNVLNDNLALGNPTDLLDEGVGNCGSGNTFETGDALSPC